jgi:hypothetical protein
MFHSGLDLTAGDISGVYDALAAIDWSRTNRAWVDEARLGTWSIPRGASQEQVVIIGAGRNNTQAIIDYLRVKTGLQAKLDGSKQAAAAA